MLPLRRIARGLMGRGEAVRAIKVVKVVVSVVMYNGLGECSGLYLSNSR